MKSNITLGIAVIAIVIAIMSFGSGNSSLVNTSPILGGTTNYDTLETTSLAVGSGCGDSYSTCTGSAVTQMYTGTCNLVSDASIAATSTGLGYCSITGVASGDKVFVSLATTTTKMAAQWALGGAMATTSNVIGVRLINLTGAAATPSATNGFGSSTQYWVVR